MHGGCNYFAVQDFMWKDNDYSGLKNSSFIYISKQMDVQLCSDAIETWFKDMLRLFVICFHPLYSL